ncbi:MAG: hypothetical protein OXC31_01665 [Spirochaetaceae bacterium]|nr:hypothetical protein [Spirochaetaceae bacterium]
MIKDDAESRVARDWIEQELRPLRWEGDEATIRCPLPEHTDRNPSAGANAAKAVWNCHRCGGGTLTDLAGRLGVEPPNFGRRPNGTELVYEYRNAQSEVVFEVVRRPASDGKTFRQRHRPSPGALYVWKAPPESKGLPYRLPDVLAAVRDGKPVLIVEGEKDVDRLSAMGFAATCNAGGAGKWTPKHAKWLPPETKVYVLPDCDVPGIEHSERVCSTAASQGCDVYAVDPRDAFGFQIELNHGRDVSDWLDEDPSRGRIEIEAMLNGATPKVASARTAAQQAADAPPDDGMPTIYCARGGRGQWTREAVKALVDIGPSDDRRSLYGSVRMEAGTGSNLGDVVTLAAAPPPEPDSRLLVPEGTLLIRPAKFKSICRRLDRSVHWYTARRNRFGDDTFEPANSTPNDAEHILETYRDDLLDIEPRPRLRTLRGVVDSPTLRPDGSLIDMPGWDAETWLYADFNAGDWQGLSSSPTRDDARKALELLYDLVHESPFAEPIHRAMWAALVLTMVGRPYATGNVPLFAFTANAPGVGKGTLVDLASIIATGRLSAKWAPVSGRRTDAENEERKRLMSIALGGHRCVCIDNVRPGEPIGTPALEGALTSGTDDRFGTVADRVLGETAVTEAPWVCVMTATGNNLTVVGDMARRTLLCRLATNDEDPETRAYRHHPKVADHCLEHRRELLVAALTVLIAHRDAVKRGETSPLPRIGSFGGWSDRIRSAVAWADPECCDPWATNAEVKAEAQPEQAEAATFLAAWVRVFGTREMMAREIATTNDPELRDAIAGLSVMHSKDGVVKVRSLSRWLSAHKDRPGPFTLHEGKRQSGKPARWYVVSASPVASYPLYSLNGGEEMVSYEELMELLRSRPTGWTLVTRYSPVLIDGELAADVGEQAERVAVADNKTELADRPSNRVGPAANSIFLADIYEPSVFEDLFESQNEMFFDLSIDILQRIDPPTPSRVRGPR